MSKTYFIEINRSYYPQYVKIKLEGNKLLYKTHKGNAEYFCDSEYEDIAKGLEIIAKETFLLAVEWHIPTEEEQETLKLLYG